MKLSGGAWRVVVLLALCCGPAATFGQLRVTVRESSGNVLSDEATVRLTPISGGTKSMGIGGREVRTNAGVTLIDIWPGEYLVDVDAPGYQRASTQASVLGGATVELRIYLTPLKKPVNGDPPPNEVVMTPALKKEMDQASSALAERNLEETRKHLMKALELAPSKAEALYLLGVVEYTEKNIPAARKDFEEVLAKYPEHPGSALMLGQIKLESGEKQEAVPLLERAVSAAPDKWLAHSLLANAYARTGQLDKAWAEAERTGELNRQQLPAMRILEVKILLKQKKFEEAKEALSKFVTEFPNDPATKAAQEKLEELRATTQKQP